MKKPLCEQSLDELEETVGSLKADPTANRYEREIARWFLAYMKARAADRLASSSEKAGAAQ